mmetsp:Transcript_20972/g.28908  ORF Transcript_20972/g.28908 Transcript_20972/m.28908 type:complete len:129 (-) Transcript_20972:128-514(-)|eukprot:CAMPEP_0201480942 /NCGR_PEP_ID=MMETSP0151_2-20130828/5304_1 /ASSEMBLY_ACC=CAM_ASM_000257 /TAXON_ID=200890 /ORGANISM="Paramoeba atlantica, Strain 621/1 / CCAP 1560/9" /LENGTH=128 /DNA_ID=CAMNT_0047862941 /DNA_START=336 /DNA_END=722 /DNA_ORIENTATION=+
MRGGKELSKTLSGENRVVSGNHPGSGLVELQETGVEGALVVAVDQETGETTPAGAKLTGGAVVGKVVFGDFAPGVTVECDGAEQGPVLVEGEGGVARAETDTVVGEGLVVGLNLFGGAVAKVLADFLE